MGRVILLLAALLALTGAASGETLTLKDCLSRAGSANKGLRVASHDERLAQEEMRLARSARLPRIDVNAGFTAQQASQAVNINRITAETQDADYPFFSLSIYDTLYDFGRTEARESAATMQRNAARANYSANQQDLFLQVVRAYYGILEARKLVTAANDEALQMASHQKTAQALYDEGVVTRNDLLQAEVRVAASKQKVYSANNAVANGWLLLNYLTGQSPEYRADLEEEIEPPQPEGDQTQPDLSGRGEIQAAKAALAAGEYAVTEAKTYYYPEIYARAGMDYLENSKVREQVIMAATIGLKVNLYDGGATTARLRQAVEARNRDLDRLIDLQDRVKLELATARNDMSVASARIKVAERAIQQGMENLRITKDKYQEKVGTATEVVDAQTLLTQTRTDYYQSIFDYEVAAARVKRAVGEL
jgi:outer membrane protein